MTQYSPYPIEHYPVPAASSILSNDPDAWRLAYLSWDFDTKEIPPDPQFSTHVRRSMCFVLGTGELDLNRELPPSRTVRGFMSGPAPQAARKLINMERLKELPLFKAYGQTWMDTLVTQARKFREPHDEKLDMPIVDMTPALEVIRKLK